MQEAVDQGIVLMPSGGMHHQALGLIDDQHILVFIHDVQVHLGGADIHGLGFGDLITDLITDIQFIIFLSGLTVATDSALFNELLGCAAA